MNIQICSPPVQICKSNGTEYIVVDPSNLNLTFKKVGRVYHRTLELVQHENENFNGLDPRDCRLPYINHMIKLYAEDAGKISQRLGIKIEGSDIECLRSFKVQVEKLPLEPTTVLNLCNLGLGTLPCIEIFNRVGRINLSGNSIFEWEPLLGLYSKVIDLGNDAYGLSEKFHTNRRMKNITFLPQDSATQTIEWRQRDINQLK